MFGFIIMQIEDPDLDAICEKAIVPAIEACGLEARRVDKHNEGGLLKSEIIRFIGEASVIVADLTNERPNVYLEIGYAMGIDKFRNLILTVRQDHFPEWPGRKPGDPKVHFDLAGYDILRWSPDDIPAFCTELEKRLRRRLALVTPSEATSQPIWDGEWLQEQFMAAASGLEKLPHPGRMLITAALHPPKGSWTQRELLDAARQAPIHTFGWPICLFMENSDDARPRPRSDGIFASIEDDMTSASYDYWAIRLNGDVFSIKSIFEDDRRPEELFFNIRIIRVTEAILYCLRLYSSLGVDRTTRLSIRIEHLGLRGRVLSSSSPNRWVGMVGQAGEDSAKAEISGTFDDIETNLVQHVKKIVAPILILFDFFELNDSVYEEIVTRFLKGEVS